MKNVSAFLKRHSALLLLVLVLATVPAGIAFGKYVRSVNVTNEISIKVSVATSANEYTINKNALKDVMQDLDNPATALHFVKGSGVPDGAVQLLDKDTTRAKDIRANSKSGSIYAYQIGKDIYIAPADNVDAPLYAPVDSSYFLSIIYNGGNIPGDASKIGLLESIKCDNLNTSRVKNMSWMFYGCRSLSSLDLSNFDTSNVTTMRSMFEDCSGLTSLNVSSFDTSNVTNMMDMFEDCRGLTSLNVSSFVTSRVENMSYMFKNCTALLTLDVSNFTNSNVTTMSYMFYGCTSLLSLDLSKFGTRNVVTMGSMFDYCSALTSLNVSSFDTRNVKDMSYMFENCTALTTINASDKFNTGKVTSSNGMFANCTNLKGGNGTPYNSSKTDKTYARIDGGTNNPGYFTGDATSTLSVTGSIEGSGISLGS